VTFRRGLNILTQLFLVAALVSIGAVKAWALRDYRPHEGYTTDPLKERSSDSRDLELLPPLPSNGPPLSDRIFTDKLSREFRERYEQKFGRTEIERIYLSPNRSTYYNDVYGLHGSPQEISNERRQFAEYMLKRLAEFHVDNYAKNDPNVRPVWEAKEKISNIKLEVQHFRFDLQYSISGNTFDMEVKNPYLNQTKLHIDMDPSAIGPANIQETILIFGKDLTKTISLEWDYYVVDGISKTVARKAINSRLALSATLSTFVLPSGKSTRESIYLAGLTYAF
jgi:hypothetical protein